MKQKALSLLVLIALVLVGCSSPASPPAGPLPEPTINLIAYEGEVAQVTLDFYCADSGEQRIINLSEHDFIIPLNTYKPSCDLESAPFDLEGVLDEPGFVYNVDNVSTAGVGVLIDGKNWDIFSPKTRDGKKADLAYVEGSGQIRYKGTIKDEGIELNVDIDVSFSSGWLALVFEEIEESHTIKMYQVPVNSLTWERGELD